MTTVVAALLLGCTTTPEEANTAQTVSARCEQTGSNLPRRECRDVQVLAPQQLESLKGAERPKTLGN